MTRRLSARRAPAFAPAAFAVSEDAAWVDEDFDALETAAACVAFSARRSPRWDDAEPGLRLDAPRPARDPAHAPSTDYLLLF